MPPEDEKRLRVLEEELKYENRSRGLRNTEKICTPMLLSKICCWVCRTAGFTDDMSLQDLHGKKLSCQCVFR
jgi:hypothetical protein